MSLVVPSNPIVVEGYSTEGTVGDRYSRGRARAATVREYIIGRFNLTPQNTGFISLGEAAPGSPTGEQFDGVAITLFLDRDELQFVPQPAGAR